MIGPHFPNHLVLLLKTLVLGRHSGSEVNADELGIQSKKWVVWP